MIFDNSKAGKTVGSFTEDKELGIRTTLTTLSETFSSKYRLDYAKNIVNILEHQDTKETYKDILLEDYFAASCLDQGMHQRNSAKLDQLFENSASEMIAESLTANLNPVVGLTFPLLKRFWINCVFKDIIPTEVATAPVFKKGIEYLYLEDENGKKHMLPEAFLKKNRDTLFGMTRHPLTDKEIAVPSLEYDLITESGGSVRNQDSISRDFYISEVIHGEDVNKKTVQTKVDVEPGTGMFGYTLRDDAGKAIDYISGTLDFETGILTIGSTKGIVKGIKVTGRLSSENNLRTASVGWDKQVMNFTIPDGTHLNTGLTEERIKDEKIVNNIDTTAKAIQLMTDTLVNLKDINMMEYLEESAKRLALTDHFVKVAFDCKPGAQGYSHTPTEWRQIELKETLDKTALTLKHKLRNKNCYFVVYGNPLNIRLFDNVQWMYGKDAQIAGNTLDYNLGIYNGQHKFLLVSSDRVESDNLGILVIPTTDEIITYKNFDYQFVISNQYKMARNVRIPSVMLFERHLTTEVTPIAGEMAIKNNHLSVSEMYK